MDNGHQADGRSEDHLDVRESGIFTWDLNTNRLNGDGAIAKLFGLDARSVFNGLPLQSYIERIHTADRAKVARAIHTAVVSGDPYHEEYRVLGAGDMPVQVLAFGRCFRDEAGNPAQYAGIVFPAMTRSKDSDPVLAHIAMAHKIAVEDGRADIADALEAILEDLSRSNTAAAGGKPH